MKKHPGFRIGLFFAFALSVCAAWAGDYTYTFDFTPADVTLSASGSGETFVSLKDGEFGEGNPGKPWIPHKVFSVRLPAGEVLTSTSVEVGETVLLAEDIVPVPEQLPVPTSAEPGEYPPVPRDGSAYASSDPYPALRSEHLHTGSMRGIKIASFRVSPLWYVGAEKKLYLAKSVTVKYTTAMPPARKSLLSVGLETEMPGSPLFEEAVNSLVVNPKPAETRKGMLSVGREGGGCQYLVITTRALVAPAQKLADFRAGFDNVTTEVLTLEDIMASTSWSDVRPDGKTDVPTKIRNCIKWYVQNRGTEYVVLAGDDTVVPKRGVHVKCGEKEYTDAPSDLYYSDLDGTWDQNQDGDYAYTTASDGTDLYPDVIVGRIPIRNAPQLAHYIDKVVAYERGTTDDSDIVRKALWMGHTQWQDLKRTSSGWVSVEGSVEDAKYRSFTETFNDGLFEVKDRPVGSAATDAEVWTRRLNQSWHRTYRPNVRSAFLNTSATSWDTESLGDFKKTYGEGGTIHAVLNQGWHQLWVSCHGVPAQWVLNDSYRNSDAVTLTNRVDFVYTISCLTAAFDDSVDPCLSESFLRAPSGAVAYIGCSREGWGTKMTRSSYDDWVKPGNVSGYSERYAVEFWRRVFDKGDKKIGPAFAAHKSAKVSSSSSTGADRWLQLLLNLQGDPLLTYHLPPDKTKEPDTRADGKPGLVTLLRDNLPETTSSSVSVRLAADAIPLGSSATVALEYSKSSTFSSATSVTVDAAVKKAGEYEKELAGLSPATDYHVRGMITIDGVTHLSPFSLTLTTKSADYVSPTPVIAPASGSFSGKLTVTMTSAASDVTIRYTTDGSEPTAASRAYEGPFVIDFTTDFRAVAFRDGVRLGGVAQATYAYAAEVGTPKGDLFADPIVIRGESGVLTIPSLPLYSVEAGEIDHTQGKRDTPVRKSIWLEWTAPGSGEVSFTSRCMNGSQCLGSALAVYTGDTMSALALVAESRATLNTTGNPNLSFTAVEGTTYRIAPLSWLIGTDPYSCIVTWEGSLTSDGSYVDPGFPGPGTEPDPGPGTDPDPEPEQFVMWNGNKIPYTGLADAKTNVGGTSDSVLVFTNGVGSFTLPVAVQADILVVGGGAGGVMGKSSSSNKYNGHGGNSGAVAFTNRLSLAAGAYSVTVGTGGEGRATMVKDFTADNPGTASSISGSGLTTLTAAGGTAWVTKDDVDSGTKDKTGAVAQDGSSVNASSDITGATVTYGIGGKAPSAADVANKVNGTAAVGFGGGGGGSANGGASAPGNDGVVIVRFGTVGSSVTPDVAPGTDDPGTEPDPGTDPEPQDAYASYRKTDGTPQSILLSYYDGPDTRGFAWQTSVDTATGALWILAGNYGASANAQFATNQVATATSAKQSECYTHKAHVLGLKPGVYSYRLGTEGHFAYGSFTVKAETNPFVALNVNDVQTKVAERIDCWDRTLAAAKSVLGSASNVDMILSGGDFIDNAFSYSDYLEWGVAADRTRPSFADVPWTMASGNHDPALYHAVIDENFQHKVSGHWGCHSYDVGNVHIVNLPYYSSWIAEVGTWLEADLAACTSKWRVVMMHYGPYTTVDHGSTAGETFVKAVSGICAKGKVDLVLQAHDHGYSKTLPYLWSGAGYAMSDSDKATTVNVAPTVESIGGESYYKDPKGTVYISAGCAGHRVGEGKSYATTAYKSRSTKIFVDTIKVGSSAGAEASLVPDNQMFGVLKVDGDKLAYDWYLAETDGSATLFDSLRLYKTAASDEPDPGDEPGPGGDDPGPGPGPGDEPGPEENYVRWSTYKIPYGGLAKGIENYDGTTDTVLVFTNGVGSFSLPAQAQAKVLVVGGGGGAGGGYKTDSGSLYFGIGGNGGSVVEKSLLLTNSSYVVSVGAGGLGGDGNGIAGGNDAGQSGTVSGIWTGSAAIVTAQPGMGGKGGETANQKGTGGSAGAPTTGVTSTVYSGTYGKGGRDASNTSKDGDSAAANTGDGGRGARDRFSGGAGGSGIVVVRITAMSGEVVDPDDDPGTDPDPDPEFETVQETLFFTEISKHVLSTTNGASAAWTATATGGVRLMQNATTAVTELSGNGASFALPINGYTGDSTGTVTVTRDGVKVAVYEVTVLADLDETAASAQWRSAVKTATLRVGESLAVSFCHPSSAKYWRYADGMYNDTTRTVYTYSGTATVVTDPVCTESASAFYTTAATRNFAATFTATEPGTVFVAVLFGSNASNQRHYAGVYEITVTGSGASESWDVPGQPGGINAIVDGEGRKHVRFTSISLADGKLTLGLEAGQVDADGQVFGLVCKENLTDAKTFTVNVTLKNGAAATLGTLEGLTDKPQLFILGIGPKE